jgi:ketosteroid isomerase-like protein
VAMVIDSRRPTGETGAAQTELTDFLKTVLVRQIDAERAIHNHDVDPWLDMWSQEDPVTLFGASGPSKSGWDEVSRTFHWVASHFTNGGEYNFELLAADISGDLAYTVGYERERLSVNGGPSEPRALRVTHLYRREHGEWKIVHRHADHPPVDGASVQKDAPGLERIIKQYHRALDEFVNGRPTVLQALFSHRDDVSLANPIAPVARGWENVARTQGEASSQFQSSEPIDFERVSTYVTSELAFMVEMERWNAKPGDMTEMRPVALRVTTIFRPEDGIWKIVHRHADTITSPRPLESIVQ